MTNKIKNYELKQMQALPLEAKIQKSLLRIREWIEEWDGRVYVSYSGGKDSIVLLDLVRSVKPDVVAIYGNTGLEFPEVRKFVNSVENTMTVRPRMFYPEVVREFGYPVVNKTVSQTIHEFRRTKMNPKRRRDIIRGKGAWTPLPQKWKFLLSAPFPISHKCCDIMKKEPFLKIERVTGLKPFVGITAIEGTLRKQSYLRNGCNAFTARRPLSQPIAFWKQNDVWEYIRKKNLRYPEIYDMGYKATACVFCLFGVHRDINPNRIQLLRETHPKIWRFGMERLHLREVMEYMGLRTHSPLVSSDIEQGRIT